MLRIKKIFNNNVVLVIDTKGLERILIGRGIAFRKRGGETVEKDKIEKTFVVDSPNVADRFVQLIEEVPINRLEMVTVIVKAAEAELERTFDWVGGSHQLCGESFSEWGDDSKCVVIGDQEVLSEGICGGYEGAEADQLL